MRARAGSPSRLRWATLFLCCVVLFGAYYCYDNPSALHDQLRARLVARGAVTAGAFEYDFSLLYTVYSMPNVVLPLIGGVVSVFFSLALVALSNQFSLLPFSSLIALINL